MFAHDARPIWVRMPTGNRRCSHRQRPLLDECPRLRVLITDDDPRVGVISITRLLGWAALVGGGLSGTVAGLLFLGPMLGFYGFGDQSPGPRSSGALELPAALVAPVAQRPATAAGLTAPPAGFALGGPSAAIVVNPVA